MIRRVIRFCCLLLLLNLSNGIKAQVAVSVKDAATFLPVEGAVVTVHSLKKDQKQIFITNNKGQVVFNQTTPFILNVKSIGYNYYTDTVNSGFTINVLLHVENFYLKEAVISDPLVKSKSDQTVNNLQVIKSETFIKMAAINAKDVLSNQLNFRISQDNATGSGNLSLQGIGGQNVKILIDGVPVIGKIFDQVDLTQLNLNNIDRIEVIQGPMSVSYGSNALAGTFNIITKKPIGKQRSGGITSYYESNKTYNIFGNWNYSVKNAGIQLNAGRNFFGGWSALESDRTWDWNLKELYFTRGQLFYKVKNWDINWRTDFNREKIKDRGTPNIYGEQAIDEYFRTLRFDNAVQLNRKIKSLENNTIISSNYYRRTSNKVVKDLVNVVEIPSTNPLDYDTTSFSAWLLRSTFVKKANKISVLTGIDASLETGSGRRIENKIKSMHEAAFFGSLQYLPGKKNLEFRTGLRAGYHSVYQMPIIPSFQMGYKNKNWEYRASWAKGFRAPGLKELYLDFVDANHQVYGNPLLKAEKSDNLQATVSVKKNNEKFILKSSVTGFYNYIQNKIDLIITSSTGGRYQNAGVFTSKGFNANADFIFNGLSQQVGISYTGINSALNDSVSYSTFWSPEIQYNLSYTWEKYNLTVSYFSKYNGAVKRYSESSEVSSPQVQQISAYYLADIIISKKLGKSWIIGCGSKNIFNIGNVASSATTGVHSSGNSISIGTGRTFFLKIDYQWKG